MVSLEPYLYCPGLVCSLLAGLSFLFCSFILLLLFFLKLHLFVCLLVFVYMCLSECVSICWVEMHTVVHMQRQGEGGHQVSYYFSSISLWQALCLNLGLIPSRLGYKPVILLCPSRSWA